MEKVNDKVREIYGLMWSRWNYVAVEGINKIRFVSVLCRKKGKLYKKESFDWFKRVIDTKGESLFEE